MAARLLPALALGLFATAAAAEQWPVHALRTSIYLNPGITDDLDLEVRQLGAKSRAAFARHRLSVVDGRDMVFQAVAGKELHVEVDGTTLDRLLGRGVAHRGGFELRRNGQTISLDGFVLAPGFAPRTFELQSRDGDVLFVADYAHFEVNEDSGQVQLFNLDLKIANTLALRLGQPELAGQTVGLLELDLDTSVPLTHAKAVAPPACGDWSGEKDVRLVDIGSMGQWSRQGGKVAISPSARLKNVGTGNVPWQSKFSQPAPPYNTDQHPFLVWAIYRLHNGVFEQLGQSDVKHAFVTINVNCTAGACTQGSILGLGCEDVYGVGTNQSTGSLSFRNEIHAWPGLWNHTGSHFDQNADGFQDHNGGDAFPIHRTAIAESDLQVAGAQYFIEAWYVVRDDINIFNSMGWQRFTPTLATNWTFAMNTAFVNGSVLDAYVPSTAPPAGSMSTDVTLSDGHVRLAVRTTDLGGGQWRYDYVLMNFDFDRQIASLRIPTGGVPINNPFFNDPDNVGSDWTMSSDATSVTWTKSDAQGLDWGTMFSFGFTTNVPARTAKATLVPVEFDDLAQMSVSTLVPADPGHVFADEFD